MFFTKKGTGYAFCNSWPHEPSVVIECNRDWDDPMVEGYDANFLRKKIVQLYQAGVKKEHFFLCSDGSLLCCADDIIPYNHNDSLFLVYSNHKYSWEINIIIRDTILFTIKNNIAYDDLETAYQDMLSFMKRQNESCVVEDKEKSERLKNVQKYGFCLNQTEVF